MPRTRRLSELRAPEIPANIGHDAILVLPMGAVEQHGPHLPFNTDLVIANACAEAVASEVGDELDLWLLEPLAYTKSNEHAGTPGTVWLGPETMLRVLDDLARSLATTSARRLVFLNGHGGNSSLLNVACRELRLNHGFETFLLHPSLPPDQGGPSAEEELGMGVHGGVGETSMMLHLRPDLVDMSLAQRNIPEHLASNDHVRFGGSVSFGWLANDFGPLGLIGDPTAATAERGAESFNASVSLICDALREVRAFRF